MMNRSGHESSIQLAFRHVIDQRCRSAGHDGQFDPRIFLRVLGYECGLRLPALVAQYAQKYPRVELAIVTGTTTSLINDVAERELDGAFVAGPVHHRELSEEPLFLEDLVLVSPLSIRNFDDLVKVENLKVIVLQQGCSYRERL